MSRLDLTQLKLQAKELHREYRAGAAAARSRVRPHFPQAAALSLQEAQLVIARENGFASWSKLKRHAESPAPVSEFDRAVAAIIGGEAAALQALLAADPALIRARSGSDHRAMLLHYMAANGVEDELQHTPANAVEIAQILLAAGAEVDALAGTYGGGSRQTTLNLLVSSVHPARAGVQAALVAVLVDAGAAVEGLDDDGYPIQLAIDFGYTAAAQMLAQKGARIRTPSVAAGLGRVDALERLLAANNDQGQSELALLAACRHGQAGAAGLLLDRGVAIDAQPDKGGTGLHQAIFAEQTEVVRLLLARGADPEIRHAAYAATALDFASYNGKTAMVELLLAHGGSDPEIPLQSAIDQGHQDIALLLRQYGAAAKTRLQ